MRTWSPLYEGDAIIHYGGATGASAAGPAAPRKAARRSIRAWLRGAAAGFFGWLETAAERARQRDLEAYLSQSSDLADLERRMREVERSYSRPFGNPF